MPADDLRPLIEDAALPGGALVLSTSALQAWLSETLGTPCDVVPRRLRYKSGTSAVLGFDLTVERHGAVTTVPCVASTYCDEAAPKIAKAQHDLAPHVQLAHDHERHTLVTTAEGDRRLPLLPRLGQPDGIVRLMARLLPDARDTAGARIRTVRHNPGRRWVGTLEHRGEPTVLLRAYRDAATTTAAAATYRSLTRAAVPTPRVVARSRSLAVLAVSWVDGIDLGRTDHRLDLWRAAGRGLARLHETSSAGLHRPGPDPEVKAVLAAGRQIAVLLPALADEALTLAHAVARELRRLPAGALVIHGDFSPDQVITGPDRLATLIDLDAARLGSAAYDLGCLAASTTAGAEAATAHDCGEARMSAFMAGYEAVRRPPDRADVALHEVAFRLRKAVDPFRDCAPDWRVQVVRRLGAARCRLDDALAVGGGR